MRTVSCSSLVLLCAAVALVCSAAVPVTAARTQAECEYWFSCAGYENAYTIIAVGSNCQCCRDDSGEIDVSDCLPAGPVTHPSGSDPALCAVAHCETCVEGNTGECALCEEGYELATPTDCLLITTTTTEAPTTSTSTTEAPTTTTTTTAAPATCNVAHCTTCVSGNASACEACQDGYYVSEGRCVLSGKCQVANCAQCMLLDMTKCSTCQNGYVPTTTYQCALNEGHNSAAAPQSWIVAVVVVAAAAIAYLV